MKRWIEMTVLAVFLFSVIPSGAQDYTPVPVSISKEKVKVDGRVYYSHIVLEKQTLYSICKAYGVTEDEIYEANPTLRETGLKKNAIILIPAETKQKAKSSGDDKNRETVTEQESDGTDFIIHTVRWFEDLDAISEKYGVSVKDIMDLNGLSGRKLSNRQKLKIPVRKDAETVSRNEVQDEAQPADSTVRKETRPIREKALFKSSSGEKVSAVLMLPFNSQAEYNEGCIDFYSGMLLAVQEMGKSGMNIDLSVYDVANGALPVTFERLASSDIVIGPISSGDLSRLMEKCPNTTYVVSPLDHRAEHLSDRYANFIQAPSSALTQYEDLASWIKEDSGNGDRVIVISEKNLRSNEGTTAMNNILDRYAISYRNFSYSILEGRDIQGSLSGLMDKNAENRVLILSESEAFVNDVIRNLNLLIHKKYRITLYGPSKLRSFDTIEVDNLHNARLHTSSTYYVDYDDPAVIDFVMKYRALYNTEPTPFSFQGYDIARYFIPLCAGEHGKWYQDLESESGSMLQTDFRFIRNSPDKGYVNNGVRRIIYGPDYQIQYVKRKF